MLITTKIKLYPNELQRESLLKTMRAFNAACNHISVLAFENKTNSKFKLQKMCYYDVRETFNLSAQMTVRAIGKVAESYKTDNKTLHEFSEYGAIVFDERILSFNGLESASILTLDGRISVPMIVSEYHYGILAGRRVRGQADLVFQDGKFFLLLVVDMPDKPTYDPDDFIGVDLGIKNIAVDSTGEVFSGAKVNNIRRRNAKLRAKLQAKGTKSAKRLLKKRSKKESRFVRDVNHCIAKKIVAKAQDTQYGIALENLQGIRAHAEKTVRKAQRAQHSSWSFYQLRQFIEYKAKLNGVPVVLVDPRYTSQTCPVCGNIDKHNRPDRDHFCCTDCGFSGHADNIAAENIRRAAVIQPNAVA